MIRGRRFCRGILTFEGDTVARSRSKPQKKREAKVSTPRPCKTKKEFALPSNPYHIPPSHSGMVHQQPYSAKPSPADEGP